MRTYEESMTELTTAIGGSEGSALWIENKGSGWRAVAHVYLPPAWATDGGRQTVQAESCEAEKALDSLATKVTALLVAFAPIKEDDA